MKHNGGGVKLSDRSPLPSKPGGTEQNWRQRHLRNIFIAVVMVSAELYIITIFHLAEVSVPILVMTSIWFLAGNFILGYSLAQ